MERGSTLAEFFSCTPVFRAGQASIEELDNELTRKVRVLDKLVDELAKGRAMEIASFAESAHAESVCQK